MKDMTDIILPGMRISRVAEILCANAPARAEVNTVTMRARYATTKPADVAEQYRRAMRAKYSQNPGRGF
jgi:hypothetical protein